MSAPAIHRLRVYWEDTDASGVVYHASYLRFFERARTEWLRALGFDQDRLLREFSTAFTVASLSIDYRSPARLDDALEVQTEIGELRRASLRFRQTLRRSADTTLLSRAEVRVGCVATPDFRPRALPAALLAVLEGFAKADPAAPDDDS